MKLYLPQNTNHFTPNRQNGLYFKNHWLRRKYRLIEASKLAIIILSFFIFSYALIIGSSSFLTVSKIQRKLISKYTNQNISLPQARMLSMLICDEQTIYICIDRDEKLFIDNKPVKQKDIKDELERWNLEKQNDGFWSPTAIFIIDKYNKMNMVQKIIRLLNENDFADIYFVAQQDE